MTPPIGSSVHRVAPNGRLLSAVHLVESTITDRAVTKCGRLMEAKTEAGHLEVIDVKPTCLRCQ